MNTYLNIRYFHREPPSQAYGLLMARASSRPAPESRLRTPDFRKGFENPRNLREGSLSGQRQSGCGSSSRVERARATRCCGLSARVCVVCVLFQIKPEMIGILQFPNLSKSELQTPPLAATHTARFAEFVFWLTQVNLLKFWRKMKTNLRTHTRCFS